MRTQKLRQVFGAIAILLLFTLTATAQDNKGTEAARAVTNHMKEGLSLNDGQYTKVYAVNLDFMEKAIDNRDSGKSKIEKAKRLKALTDERDAKLKSVLSGDQYKKFIANKAENRKKLREHLNEKE